MHIHIHIYITMFMLGTHLLDNRKVLPLLLSGFPVIDGALIWLIKDMHRGRVVSVVVGIVVNEAAGDMVVVDDSGW